MNVDRQFGFLLLCLDDFSSLEDVRIIRIQVSEFFGLSAGTHWVRAWGRGPLPDIYIYIAAVRSPIHPDETRIYPQCTIVVSIPFPLSQCNPNVL